MDMGMENDYQFETVEWDSLPQKWHDDYETLGDVDEFECEVILYDKSTGLAFLVFYNEFYNSNKESFVHVPMAMYTWSYSEDEWIEVARIDQVTKTGPRILSFSVDDIEDEMGQDHAWGADEVLADEVFSALDDPEWLEYDKIVTEISSTDDDEDEDEADSEDEESESEDQEDEGESTDAGSSDSEDSDQE